MKNSIAKGDLKGLAAALDAISSLGPEELDAQCAALTPRSLIIFISHIASTARHRSCGCAVGLLAILGRGGGVATQLASATAALAAIPIMIRKPMHALFRRPADCKVRGSGRPPPTARSYAAT